MCVWPQRRLKWDRTAKYCEMLHKAKRHCIIGAWAVLNFFNVFMRAFMSVCVFVINALSHPSTLICTRLCLYLCASMENVKIVESTTVSYSTTIYVRSCGYLIFIFVEFCSYNKMFREHAVTAAVAIAISIIFFNSFLLFPFRFFRFHFFSSFAVTV